MASGDIRGPAWRGTAKPVDKSGGRDQARLGRERQGAQSGQGAAELVLPGPALGKVRVRRRAERVSRPVREKKRRLRVLVVTTCSPRPMRAVQRARLWAITPYRVRGRLWTANQAALAAKRPEGRWFSPTPCLRACPALDAGSRMVFSISAWRRWSASSSRVAPSRSVMKP